MKRTITCVAALAMAAGSACGKHAASSAGSGSGSAGSGASSVAGSSSASGGSSSGAGATGDCASVIDRGLDRIARNGIAKGAAEHGGSATPEVQAELEQAARTMSVTLAPIKDAMRRACSEDRWPPEVLGCMDKANDGDALDACSSHLSADQKQHLEVAVAAARTASTANAPAACQRYASLEIECKSAGEGARSTIVSFCTKALAGANDAMSQVIALESTCAEAAKDCASYKQCVEQKKHDHAPK